MLGEADGDGSHYLTDGAAIVVTRDADNKVGVPDLVQPGL
jgi:hypothetical protein